MPCSTTKKELLFGYRVPEHEHDSRCDRDGFRVQGFAHQRPQLMRAVEPLEGSAGGQEPVAEWSEPVYRIMPLDHNRDGHYLSAQRPCLLESMEALIRILDYIDDEAQVDQIGWPLLFVRAEMGIPPHRRYARLREDSYVVPVPAAVVEQVPA